MRHRIAFGMVTITLLGAAFATALAQPPAGRDGPPPPGRGDGLRDALDTNGDHELDADEIKNASASLAKADKNGDGTIDHDEFRPPLPPIPDHQDVWPQVEDRPNPLSVHALDFTPAVQDLPPP